MSVHALICIVQSEFSIRNPGSEDLRLDTNVYIFIQRVNDEPTTFRTSKIKELKKLINKKNRPLLWSYRNFFHNIPNKFRILLVVFSGIWMTARKLIGFGCEEVKSLSWAAKSCVMRHPFELDDEEFHFLNNMAATDRLSLFLVDAWSVKTIVQLRHMTERWSIYAVFGMMDPDSGEYCCLEWIVGWIIYDNLVLARFPQSHIH